MSDTRRQIAERCVKKSTPYAWTGNPQFVDAIPMCESAMSEYAAAVLEDVANTIMAGEVNGVGGSLRSYGERWFATKLSDQLRARATEERQR